MWRASRINRLQPGRPSSRLICMLTAEVVRNICCAALVKLPLSAMQTKVRNTSISSRGVAQVGSAWRIAAMMHLQFRLTGRFILVVCLNRQAGTPWPADQQSVGRPGCADALACGGETTMQHSKRQQTCKTSCSDRPALPELYMPATWPIGLQQRIVDWFVAWRKRRLYQ